MVLTHLFSFIAVGFAGALTVQLVAFVYAMRLRRVDLVDAAWGVSFIAVVAALQVAQPTVNGWTLVVDMLVLLWGLRLSWHIYGRFRRSSKQDERYTEIMSRWPEKNRGLQTFIKIFLLQALLATVISLPVIVTHVSQPDTMLVAIVGLVVWVVGFVFETVADNQLKAFLRQSHGELMRTGLWRYSRHPNYFGEIAMWWGIALIACASPLWWVGLIGAAVITYLISFVSGVPPAEARGSMKNGWQEYKRKTSVLLPWFPKQ